MVEQDIEQWSSEEEELNYGGSAGVSGYQAVGSATFYGQGPQANL